MRNFVRKIFTMTPGQAIKELRLKKGMTQEELAAKAETKARTIQRIESDEVRPRAYTVQKIAEVLNVNCEQLNSTTEGNGNSEDEFLLRRHARSNSFGTVFLSIGILALGIALGVSTGVIVARILDLDGETNEMIVLSLIVWIGISCIACYFLSQKLSRGEH
jgi:transcriptional regulator with XRE-family HTH domain